jgi:hypothetical protein
MYFWRTSKHAKRTISTNWILCISRIRVGPRSPIRSLSSLTNAEAIQRERTLACA